MVYIEGWYIEKDGIQRRMIHRKGWKEDKDRIKGGWFIEKEKDGILRKMVYKEE